jgi:ESF2/ABP1 family protein
MWTMRYLPKFKWENLSERIIYENKVRGEKLKKQLSQARKEENFFLEKVDESHRIKNLEKKKVKIITPNMLGKRT